ncbi:cardiolipin synthase [Paenibacillus sp. N1-5-1-14]|uniref:cardiolipin synthase n=1 Tax=Paenibacillus radicibacter TaxID=2972488 RepID=UPI002159A606|nr:cardiolipin synthase [Paenibacillus radicibacter]MCR8642632.1 cardiolipin synthase [Paenibacillus radicibacter]
MKRSIQTIIVLIIMTGLLFILNRVWSDKIAFYTSIVTTLMVIFVGLVIFMDNRHPSSTMAWIMILALFPITGFIFYVLFGQNYYKNRVYGRKAERDAKAFLDLHAHRSDHVWKDFNEDQQLIFRLAQNVAKSPISQHTCTRILSNGDETFDSIIQELHKAEHHIHIEYYIYRDDCIGKQIQQILIEKSKAGVEVRFLYDAVGSYQLPDAFLQQMREVGIETYAFNDVKIPFFSSTVNYRNHRKIIVIDGKVGFTGGLNVGDEYLSRSKAMGFWRDTHMLLKGEAVRMLQFIFLQDWFHTTKERLPNPEYWAPEFERVTHDGAVQIIASGPDNEWRTIKNLTFAMITSAKKKIWIASPYFIPDEDLLTALKVAALSGVDVKVLFPAKPDRWIPFWASHSYFPALMDAGVEIYEYKKGFMHSKILIVDDNMATIGTANMDMRSYHLNFEVNAFLYGTDSVQTLIRDYEEDLTESSIIEMEWVKKKSYPKRFLESAARLLSPML